MPLSRLYGTLVDLRNRLYDRGLIRSNLLGARTISVGNITTGGTGKTPLVAYIAKVIADRGEKVCILTRGYGRRNSGERVLVSDGERILSDPQTAGDEPIELAQKLSGRAVIIADRNRVAAAVFAKQEFGISVFILDDGFQHRRASRDVDIVCIDATNPFGGGRMLPSGRLREPLDSLSRADVIVITRADLLENTKDLRLEISDLNSKAPIFTAATEVKRVIDLERFLAETPRPDGTVNGQTKAALEDVFSEIKGQSHKDKIRISAFCGLGNPDAFFKQIRKEFDKNEGLDISFTKSFPDHHTYTQVDIDNLEERSRLAKTDRFVTTAKDAVKLRGIEFSIPCYVVEIDVVLDVPDAFAALL